MDNNFNLPADLILINGFIWTVDPNHPYARAVAIRGNEIRAVGDDESVLNLAGPGTRIFDLEGRLVLPGFNDAHTHFIPSVVESTYCVLLYGIEDAAALRDRLRAFAASTKDCQWIIGRRWTQGRYAGGVWPSCFDLDEIEKDRPVAIYDNDGHSCWVNSKALELLGYDAQTPDPPGGQILRDGQGNPSGILLENAHAPVPGVQAVPNEVFSKALIKGVEGLNRLGVTSISNNGVQPGHFQTYCGLSEDNLLNLRISEWLPLEDDLGYARKLRKQFIENERIRIVGLKFIADGVLSSRTAWMKEDYADSVGETGFMLIEPELLRKRAQQASRAGFQVIIHAIGDRTISEALDIYQDLAAEGGSGLRHRIEHVETAQPQDYRRFLKNHVVALMTPMHCIASVNAYFEERVGKKRAEYGYAWRNLLREGVHLCFGTDWPDIDLAAPDPMPQIYAAATRKPPTNPTGPAWHPEQCLTVEEAVRCYTLEGAYAEFMERRKGSLSRGKLADLVVLSKNILSVPVEEILETQVVMTIMDGRIVYRSL